MVGNVRLLVAGLKVEVREMDTAGLTLRYQPIEWAGTARGSCKRKAEGRWYGARTSKKVKIPFNSTLPGPSRQAAGEGRMDDARKLFPEIRCVLSSTID